MTNMESKMVNRQLTLPSELVKKDNQLVRSKLNISNVDGSKILASLVAQIRTDDTYFKEFYTLNAKDILSNTSGVMYARIKKLCKGLLQTTVEIETPKGDSPEASFIMYAFFRSLEYRKGIIKARFNEDMRPFLLGLKDCFTQYNLLEYLLLPSFYSQRMFEILKSWSGLPEAIISMKELHQMLDTPPSFKADFKAFRTRVLEKAHKDIHKHTSLTFEWLPIKAGRSVDSIKFTFSDARKAITATEDKQTKVAKQRRLNNQNMGKALACCEAKKGICDVQDNKAVVCKLCVDFGMCADWIRRGGKPFNPRA